MRRVRPLRSLVSIVVDDRQYCLCHGHLPAVTAWHQLRLHHLGDNPWLREREWEW